ncbi:glycosyltransferase family 61 protein [Paeniglutamicibacter sp. ABSL32-1]|uniref:glycosyltransferase family 61 protein n=1 Tax=Paeniglutamicibacter quisquiliarum TaxID=2849498 RepID=UPI001C2D7F33|nr:glycosyltransferase 61 family protein [Paeniglutamicibacter quisquiliarum]MBV1780717.1 glycosyltransferase family 61 protein [Paeniglutamicibacter quisquiliarum]
MIPATSLPWSRPAVPSLAPASSAVTVDHAVLTTFQVNKLDARHSTVSGAVYVEGKLIPSSQRVGGRGGDLVTSADPETIAGTAGFNRLSGRWLYAGNWMGQFGHFITETLTTMWPRLPFDGIICHPFIFGSAIEPWQVELVRRLGFDVPIMVARQGCVVDELVVAQRPFILNDSVSPQAVGVWNRVASQGNHSRNVFLSRSKLLKDPRRVDGDNRLDDLMASKGFDIVHPQELSLNEQLATVADAGILSGVSGSALHLSAFAHPHAKVLEIGDPRSSYRALPNQRVIDDAIGRQSGYVPFIADGDRRSISETERMLGELIG